MLLTGFFLCRYLQSLQSCLSLVLASNAVAGYKHLLCPTFQNLQEEVFTESVNKQKYFEKTSSAHVFLPLSYCIIKQFQQTTWT